MGATTQQLAKKYDITRHAIEDIRTGKNWSYLPRPARLVARLSTGNGQNGPNSHFARVTWDQAQQIRARAAAGEHIVTLGREFGMSKAAVYKLIAGNTYKRRPSDDLLDAISST